MGFLLEDETSLQSSAGKKVGSSVETEEVPFVEILLTQQTILDLFWS